MTRSFRLPNITGEQVLSGIKEWNVLPFMAATTFCLYLLGMRWHYYVDTVGGFAFLIGIVICVCFIAANKEDSASSDLRSEDSKLKNRIARQVLLLAPMISLLYVGSSNGGYYLNYATGQSTFTQDLLPVSPFGRQPVYFVYKSQNQNVDVDVLTKDGVPLRCHVIANGIVLNERDPLKTEHMIFNLEPAIEPQRQIDSALKISLASAAARVLSSKTSAEVGQEKQFLIPYSIGTPLGESFQRYMLQWSEGAVNFSCRVRFSS